MGDLDRLVVPEKNLMIGGKSFGIRPMVLAQRAKLLRVIGKELTDFIKSNPGILEKAKDAKASDMIDYLQPIAALA